MVKIYYVLRLKIPSTIKLFDCMSSDFREKEGLNTNTLFFMKQTFHINLFISISSNMVNISSIILNLFQTVQLFLTHIFMYLDLLSFKKFHFKLEWITGTRRWRICPWSFKNYTELHDKVNFCFMLGYILFRLRESLYFCISSTYTLYS